jgi:hypothetical protein
LGLQGLQGDVGPTGAQGDIGLQGDVGPTGTQGDMGLQGLQGDVGPTGAQGDIGLQGLQGDTGPTGAQGPVATLGAAQFIHTIQEPNNSVPPGTAFTIDTQVFNNVPGDISPSAGAGGTIFTLSTGIYVIDYEMSLESASSVAIYTGSTLETLVVDKTTISGSSTATSWIHGRSLLSIEIPTIIAISPVVGTAAVVTAGTAAGIFMIRLTILKIS